MTKREWEILSNALTNFDYRQERVDRPVTEEEVLALRKKLDPQSLFEPEEATLIIRTCCDRDYWYMVPTRVVKEVVGSGQGVTDIDDFQVKLDTLLEAAVPTRVHSEEEDATLVTDRVDIEEAWDDFLDGLAGVAGFEHLEAR
jgi:hypothetical protein